MIGNEEIAAFLLLLVALLGIWIHRCAARLRFPVDRARAHGVSSAKS
jgi:hypothetical protein